MLSLVGLDFKIISKLLVLMVLFAIALEWVGFLVSTVFFLAGGYWLLGERRPKIIVSGIGAVCDGFLVRPDSVARYLLSPRPLLGIHLKGRNFHV